MDNYTYEYEGTDHMGRTIWSCRRDGSGICGYGNTHRDAYLNFHDIEQEVTPLPKSYLTGFSQFEPPERIDVPHWREDE